MELIEDARASGMDVTCDVYPYSAGSTMLTTIFPPWSLEGGLNHVMKRLVDKGTREKMKSELKMEQDTWDNLVVSTGWDNVIIASVNSNQLKKWEDLLIQEISNHYGKELVYNAFYL